ncbi:MAG: DUF3098 domain-containing protein [Muribaculaceae bacterium]|nr:DUF3098 domain-containing protein [Muribaculaceae bacterium]
MAHKSNREQNNVTAHKPDRERVKVGAEIEKESASTRALDKINFLLMAASAVVIVIGFLLMLGSGNDGSEFNPDIFSTRRIIVGPTIAFLGFIAMGVAIMWPSRRKTETEDVK